MTIQYSRIIIKTYYISTRQSQKKCNWTCVWKHLVIFLAPIWLFSQNYLYLSRLSQWAPDRFLSARVTKAIVNTLYSYFIFSKIKSSFLAITK